MRIAYADPPYVGQAKKHYGKESTYAGEVNHADLIDRLVREYSNGWALSCSSPSLRLILPLCPQDARVMAWVKPFAIFKPNVGVAYAWEPIIVYGGRKRTREQPTIRDWVSANITLGKGLAGAKPAEFAYWLFEVLGMHPSDTFDDLFPGTFAVTDAWELWRTQFQLLSKGCES